MRPTWLCVTALLFTCASPASRPAPGSEPPVEPAPATAPPAPPLEVRACVKAGPGDDFAEPPGEEFAIRRTPKNKNDRCEVAVSNLERVSNAILAAPAGDPRRGQRRAWDRRSTPGRLGHAVQRLALDAAEMQLLRANGFVVSRASFGTYTKAYHEIYQSQLPVYVSIDSILHAIYIGNDTIVADIEKQSLEPLVDQTLEALHCALGAAVADYPRAVARDLDLYLTVARSLLAGEPIKSVLGVDTDAAALVAAANQAGEMKRVDLFGRERFIDFTQYTPRGHYADELADYFRAAMWLSRLELNLVSRSSRSSATTPNADPRETPREAVVALALTDLIDRAGVSAKVEALDGAWSVFAGRREDVSLAELAALRRSAGITRLRIPESADALRRAIGARFARTTKFHYMPAGTTTLPVIATMLGPRLTADSRATQLLVEPEVGGRHRVSVPEMAYALGHDRARAHLSSELQRHPDLAKQLDKARALVSAAPAGPDLYSAWLRAIRALARAPEGAAPSFMSTPAFADLRVGSALAAYGQLRHNNVLIAGQPYDEGGCEIPDGYVEPAAEVYDALIDYVARAAAATARLDPKDAAGVRPYFARLATTLRVLRAIVAAELAGRPLSEDHKRFLSMVVEMSPGSTGGPPTYTGWYFDLFRSPNEALRRADFIADYFTSGHDSKVAYVGATNPRLGVFVIDSNGPPRIAVGPVARAYAHTGPLAKRLDDASARRLGARPAPWAATYQSATPAAPDLSVSIEEGGAVTATAPRPVGQVTVELLDHHRKPIASVTRDVGAGETAFKFPARRLARTEAAHVHAGGFDGWFEVGWAGGSASYGSEAGDDE